jgi:hypothetical protein
VRWLANDSPLYDPVSYNNGSAWPFMSGIAAWAEYQHDLPLAGFQTWRSLVNLTGLSAPGALPELMNGDRFLPGEFAVPHQLFSSVGVVLPAIRGLLGLRASFSGGASTPMQQITLRPTLPADWPFVRFQKYTVPAGTLSGEVQQEPGRTVVSLRNDGGKAVTVNLAPAIPALARVSTARLNGKPQPFTTELSEGYTRVVVPVLLVLPAREITLSVEYQGGIAVVPPAIHPQPGEQSSSLRVLSVIAQPDDRTCNMKLRLAGRGAQQYLLRIVSTLPQVLAENLAVHKTTSGYEISVPFEGSGYVTRTICLSQ